MAAGEPMPACPWCHAPYPTLPAVNGHKRTCAAWIAAGRPAGEPARQLSQPAPQPSQPAAAAQLQEPALRALPSPIEPASQPPPAEPAEPEQPAIPVAPSAPTRLTYIDRFPLPEPPARPACRLEHMRGLPEWRDPLGRRPEDLPGAVPPPAPASQPTSSAPAGGQPAGGSAEPAADAPSAEPKNKAPGINFGDAIADFSDAVFENDPVKPAHRKLLQAKFKTEIDETKSTASILAVIFLPKIYRSDFGKAVRSWIWEHSFGAFKRWFRWPWWGSSSSSSSSSTSSAAAEAAPAKAARPARSAVVDVELEPAEPPPAKPARAAAAAPAGDEPPAVVLTPEEIRAL